jgi:hypothetical protein
MIELIVPEPAPFAPAIIALVETVRGIFDEVGFHCTVTILTSPDSPNFRFTPLWFVMPTRSQSPI